MDRTTAARSAAELASAYPGRGITELTTAQWIAAFAPEDLPTVVGAIGDLVQQFPDRAPTLGQLQEALRIRRPQRELPGPREDIGYTRTPPMPRDLWRHGMYHLAELLALPRDERTEQMREVAQHPERCGCDKRSEEGRR